MEGALGTLEFKITVPTGRNSLPPIDFFLNSNLHEDLPSLNHIRDSIRHLHSLSHVSQKAVVRKSLTHSYYSFLNQAIAQHIAYIHLGSLWQTLTTLFPDRDPSTWIQGMGAFDHERQYTDPWHPRYNAPHDMLVYILSQTTFLVRCLDTYQQDTHKHEFIAHAEDLLKHLADGAALAYCDGGIFYGTCVCVSLLEIP